MRYQKIYLFNEFFVQSNMQYPFLSFSIANVRRTQVKEIGRIYTIFSLFIGITELFVFFIFFGFFKFLENF